MGVGVVFFVALLVFLARATEGANQQRRAANRVPAAPAALPKAGANRRKRLTLTAPMHLLFTHRAGERPTPSRLIKARRFAEASKAIAPQDHKRRMQLALHREGPLTDLLLAARGRRGKRRDTARTILTKLYPGEKWGFDARKELGTADWARSAYETVSSRKADLKLSAAARLARTIRRSFPEADTRHQTLLDLACVEALRGRADAARIVTVDIANSDAPIYVRDQASRISQRISAATRQGRSLTPVAAKSATKATVTVREAASAQKSPWPTSPHDLHQLVVASGREATDRTLEAQAIADNLVKGRDVWVGVLDPKGVATVAPIIAIEPTSQVVLMGDGVAMDVDALRRASVWGNRIVVIHLQGAEIAGTARPTPFDQMPCPRDDAGRVDHSAQALRILRAAVREFAGDALASYNYAVALEAADQSGGHAAYDPNQHRQHLALSAARFPGATWPLLFLSNRPERDGDPRPGALLAVGLAGTLPAGDIHAAAHAMFDSENADALLRDDLTVFRTRFYNLEDAAHRAAARCDGKDLDVHLDLLQRVARNHASIPRLQQAREVVWRGLIGAIPAVKGEPSDPDGSFVRLRLAANSGNAGLLRTHAGSEVQTSHLRESRDARVLLAMHSGDYDTILDEAQAVVATDGLSQVIGTALATATEVLAAPDDTRLAAALDFAISNGDRELLNLTGLLLTRRAATAVDILRAKVGQPGDAVDIHARLTRALIHRASEVPAAEREPLAREALASMALIEPAKSTVHMWDCYEAAAWRLIDPDRAFDVLTQIEHLRVPLTTLLLAAAVATDRGDDDVARRMVTRAANPEFIRAGLGTAVNMGIDREINLTFASADTTLVRAEAWSWLGADGQVASLPPVPQYGESPVFERALWTLVARGEFDLARRAHAHRWTPQTALDFADGAPRAALSAAISALTGDTKALREALSASKHPAYLRAAAICSSAGIDLALPDSFVRNSAPGLPQEAKA